MSRTRTLLVLGIIVIGLIVVSQIVHIRVNIDVGRSDSASASPFWREVSGEAQLPPPLSIWVDLAKASRPAVVNVSSTQGGRQNPGEEFFKRFFGAPSAPPRARMSLGSGFIVSPDGYVVTNYHVVEGAGETLVRLGDQSEHKARLVGFDARTDLALLKVEAKNLPVLPFGDSDKLQVGEPVMAIGNPFGLDQTVTTGIVSAKERFIGAGPYDDFIQIDASINPGNSGGPLIDARGAVVGINAAIFSQGGGWSGIGFAIPTNLAKDVLAQLRERGTVTRGYLGVAVAPVTPDTARQAKLPARQGALVTEVVPGSPAAKAGVKPGDVILSVQDAEIHDPHELTRRVAGTPPGTEVKLQIARGGGRKVVTTTLAKLPDDQASRPSTGGREDAPRGPRGR